MIKIVEVDSKEKQKVFINFPLSLYKDCYYYIPNLNVSEKLIFKYNNPDQKAVFFLAYMDDIVVGRIGAIIQNMYNEKMGVKQVRFTRFDCINSISVAKKLFESVEKWALDNGMDSIHGPMGFNDLEKMGIQVSDFTSEGNIITQYNFPYYKKLLEKCGFQPDASFVECKIFEPKGFKMTLSNEKYHNVKTKNANQLIKKYKTQVFDLINESYIPIYGAVPITPTFKEKLINQFKFLINMDFISIVVDNNDKVMGFGVAIPGIAKEIKESKGKLLSMKSFKMINAFIKPNYAEMLLACVCPEHKNCGIENLIASKLFIGFQKYNIRSVNTNPIIYNDFGKSILDNFEHIIHKKRVVYLKQLSDKNN